MRKYKKENINQEQFEKLCAIWGTLAEICCYFSVSEQTMRSWCKETYGKTFDETSKMFYGKGDLILRRNILDLSRKNASVAIFLAKNRLGMSDNPNSVQDNEKATELLKSLADVVKEKNDK